MRRSEWEGVFVGRGGGGKARGGVLKLGGGGGQVPTGGCVSGSGEIGAASV